MIKLAHKTKSCGISEMLFKDSNCNLIHLLFYFDSFRALDKPAFYISQISFIQSPVVFSGEGDELMNAWLLGNGPKNALDLDSFILSFRIWNEQDFTRRNRPWSEINKDPVFSLPNDMKFCFEPHPFDLRDHPTKLLFSSIGNNMLWNNRETFLQWFIGKGFVSDINRLRTQGHTTAK